MTVVTVRQALTKLCRGRGDGEVAILRRPLRHLVEIAATAEAYRRAENELARALVVRVADEDAAGLEEALRAERAARAELDRLLQALGAPA